RRRLELKRLELVRSRRARGLHERLTDTSRLPVAERTSLADSGRRADAILLPRPGQRDPDLRRARGRARAHAAARAPGPGAQRGDGHGRTTRGTVPPSRPGARRPGAPAPPSRELTTVHTPALLRRRRAG